jgi:hypothetical protein
VSGLIVLSLLLAAGLSWLLLDFSFNLARHLLPQATLSLRWVCVSAIGTWTLVALFHLLAGVGLFRPWTALTALAVLAGGARIILRPEGTWAAIRTDFDRTVEFLRAAYKQPGSWLLYVTTLLLISAVARALLMPPLAWDSLTYHLVLAARWVQSGRHLVMPAPDAWTYYQYFPANGEIITAWLMLPLHDDRLANLSCFVPWLTIVLTSYVLARHLGASARAAFQTTLIVGTLPVVLTYITTAYIDMLLLSCLLSMTLFLLVLVRDRVPAAGCLSLMAAGVALGTKSTSLPSVAVALVVVIATFRPPQLRRNAIAGTIGILCLALAALPWYLLAWRDHGSPFYPLPVSFMGRTLSAGSASLIRATQPKRPIHLNLQERILSESKIFGPKNLGLGPLALLGLCVAPWWFRDLWRRGRRVDVVVLASLIVPAILAYYSPKMISLRTNWPTVSARFVAFPFVLLTLGAAVWILDEQAVSRRRRLRAALHALVGLNLLLGGWWIIGYTPLALTWISLVTLGLLLGLYAWTKLVWLPSGAATAPARRTWLPVAGLAFLMIVAFAAIVAIRGHYYDEFRAACEDPHELQRSAEPAWRWAHHVDRPRRIAFTAGYEYPGHNWFWYPLFGDKLQNEVIYVPITRDGHIVDYMEKDQAAAEANRRAWLERLEKMNIDTAIWLPPAPIEARWISEMPDVFRPVPDTGETGIFTIDRLALGAHLATMPAL